MKEPHEHVGPRLQFPVGESPPVADVVLGVKDLMLGGKTGEDRASRVERGGTEHHVASAPDAEVVAEVSLQRARRRPGAAARRCLLIEPQIEVDDRGWLIVFGVHLVGVRGARRLDIARGERLAQQGEQRVASLLIAVECLGGGDGGAPFGRCRIRRGLPTRHTPGRDQYRYEKTDCKRHGSTVRWLGPARSSASITEAAVMISDRPMGSDSRPAGNTA